MFGQKCNLKKKILFKCKISTSSSFVELTQEISWIMNKIPVSRECSVVAGADTRSGTSLINRKFPVQS